MKRLLSALLIYSQILFGSGGWQFDTSSTSSGGGGSWGSITGTLSNQTDLQTSLDGKVNDTGNETVAGIKTFSSAPIFSSGTALTIPYLDASKALADTKLTATAATGALSFAPIGSPASLLNIDLSGLTTFSQAINITGAYPASGSGFGLYNNGTSSGTDSFHYGIRSRMVASNTTSTVVGYNAAIEGGNSGGNLGVYQNPAKASYGLFGQVQNNNATGHSVGIGIAAYAAKTNVGGYFEAVDAGVTSSNTIGVYALATGENSAQTNAVYGKINATVSGALENTKPTVAAAGLFDNGNTTSHIMVLQDNSVGVVTVTDGGNLLLDKAMVLASGTADLTADNQSVVVTTTSYVRLSSDNATATNRTFVLGDGASDGQRLTLEWIEDNSTGSGELADSGNQNLSATWSPNIGDTLSLVWNSVASEWRELGRSDN